MIEIPKHDIGGGTYGDDARQAEDPISIAQICPYSPQFVSAYQQIGDAISVEVTSDRTANTGQRKGGSRSIGCAGLASPKQQCDPLRTD